jgi:hypothetical protein
MRRTSSTPVELRLADYGTALDRAVADHAIRREDPGVGSGFDFDEHLTEVDEPPSDPDRRRPLLVAAALVVVVLGAGLPVAARFLGSDDGTGQRSSSVTSDPVGELPATSVPSPTDGTNQSSDSVTSGSLVESPSTSVSVPTTDGGLAEAVPPTEPPICDAALGPAVPSLPPVRLDDAHTLCFTQDGLPPDVHTVLYVNGAMVTGLRHDACSWPSREYIQLWGRGELSDGTPWLFASLPPSTTSAAIRTDEGTTEVPLFGDDTVQQYVFVLDAAPGAQVIAEPSPPPPPPDMDLSSVCGLVSEEELQP